MKETGVARKKSDGRSEQPRGGEGVVGDIKPVCTEDCVRITEIKCQPKERREGRVEWSGVERVDLPLSPPCWRLVLLFKSNVRG